MLKALSLKYMKFLNPEDQELISPGLVFLEDGGW